uniref:Uncharacterized protein n=1 Tax=Opuntia streptacantha TaxID=393608 RepID=A0A7C9D8S1_OPUST
MVLLFFSPASLFPCPIFILLSQVGNQRRSTSHFPSTSTACHRRPEETRNSLPGCPILPSPLFRFPYPVSLFPSAAAYGSSPPISTPASHQRLVRHLLQPLTFHRHDHYLSLPLA